MLCAMTRYAARAFDFACNLLSLKSRKRDGHFNVEFVSRNFSFRYNFDEIFSYSIFLYIYLFSLKLIYDLDGKIGLKKRILI